MRELSPDGTLSRPYIPEVVQLAYGVRVTLALQELYIRGCEHVCNHFLKIEVPSFFHPLQFSDPNGCGG